MSTSEESAKAVQEVAKTTGQGIVLVEKIGNFFARIMSETFDTTVGMLTDTLKFKRWERQIRLIERAQEIMTDRNLVDHLRPLPPKLALPLFQNASVEDNDEMHDLWAQLLVTAIDPSVPILRQAFVDILSALDPLDAHLLNRMYEIFLTKQASFKDRKKERAWKKPPTDFEISERNVRERITCADEAYWIAIDNLRRMSLCASYFEEGDVETKDADFYPVLTAHGGYSNLCITALGIEFVKACTGYK